MNEEFYAVLKLISGEEIFSKVCAFVEEDEVLVVLDNPIFVETTFIPKLNAPVARVNPWISLTEETTFIIKRNMIITMTETKDSNLIKMHKRYIKEQNKITNQSTITSNMGYIASIADARVSLENLYRSNSPSNPKE